MAHEGASCYLCDASAANELTHYSDCGGSCYRRVPHCGSKISCKQLWIERRGGLLSANLIIHARTGVRTRATLFVPRQRFVSQPSHHRFRRRGSPLTMAALWCNSSPGVKHGRLTHYTAWLSGVRRSVSSQCAADSGRAENRPEPIIAVCRSVNGWQSYSDVNRATCWLMTGGARHLLLLWPPT